MESHASVVGIREHALRAGASAAAVHLAHEPPAGWRVTPRGAQMRRGDAAAGLSPSEDDAPCLFALPAECNFSGARLDLGIVAVLQQSPLADVAGVPAGRWAVLLDAAKAAATHPPDLSVVRPHFVALSYYKIFGYPTGLGALLVRADALPLLAVGRGRGRAYWGGGGFAAAAADADFVARHAGARGLEDGTAAFTAAAAVPRGALRVRRASAHASVLTHRASRLCVFAAAGRRAGGRCARSEPGGARGWRAARAAPRLRRARGRRVRLGCPCCVQRAGWPGPHRGIQHAARRCRCCG